MIKLRAPAFSRGHFRWLIRLVIYPADAALATAITLAGDQPLLNFGFPSQV